MPWPQTNGKAENRHEMIPAGSQFAEINWERHPCNTTKLRALVQEIHINDKYFNETNAESFNVDDEDCVP